MSCGFDGAVAVHLWLGLWRNCGCGDVALVGGAVAVELWLWWNCGCGSVALVELDMY